MKSVRIFVTLLLAPIFAQWATGDESLRVYHIGNSLTRNLPLERVQNLFESKGVRYEYGIQLGGGHRLEQHLSKRNHGNKPGAGEYNTVKPFGEYDHAFKNHKFDAVVLQPFKKTLDADVKVTTRWPYFSCGDLQAASGLIDYARGKTKAGEGRWDFEHPNDHYSCDKFYIYATLSENSPVGMTAAPYEQFDEQADAELIDALQQTVQTVVVGHKHTGVNNLEQQSPD